MLKYIAWNAFLIGTLAAGYYANAQRFAGIIIGIVYSILLPILFVGMFIFQYATEHPGKTDVTGIMKALEKRIWYKWFLEVLFIAATFAMGYNKIGICMIAELAMFAYLYSSYRQYKKDQNEVKQ